MSSWRTLIGSQVALVSGGAPASRPLHRRPHYSSAARLRRSLGSSSGSFERRKEPQLAAARELDGPAARLSSRAAASGTPQPETGRAGLAGDGFARRHIGPSELERGAMLASLGYSSLDELVDATVPRQIRLARPLRLPEPVSEAELLEELAELADLNEGHRWLSFIGMGFYDCITPPVIARNLFENPGWTSAYTAYQAEVAQGRLESLMNYQQLVCDLTGLDVANASLLDEASAAAEALQVSLRWRQSRDRAGGPPPPPPPPPPYKWLVSSRCNPQTLAVVGARARGLGVQVDQVDELSEDSLAGLTCLEHYSGLLLQYPNTHGHLFDWSALAGRCKAAGCLVVVATDLLACALLRPPGDFSPRADLAVGSSQRLGVPLNFGGPHAAFLAARDELVRLMPGRIVGVTRDSAGQSAFRFALQTREQHIRRDRATSNICTAQALLANMSAMYAVYHGPEGLRRVARAVHAKTRLLARLVTGAEQLAGAGVKLLNESYFDTLTFQVEQQEAIRLRAQASKYNLRYEGQDRVLVSLDEAKKVSQVLQLAQVLLGRDSMPRLEELASFGSRWQESQLEDEACGPAPIIGQRFRRSSKFLEHPNFNSHHSEQQLVRYMKQLENKDLSLVHSMIPLGSCTMKLNGTAEMLASSWPQFARLHPFQPLDQCQGYMRLLEELNEYLCEITGYERISFQPNSGAQGEYAGLSAIREYLAACGQSQRDLCLIPVSAHGTNPASAQMAGFRIETVRVQANGNIDLVDLARQIERHQHRLACLMVTYPSTYGVFESSIGRVCELVHEAGGQVYLDGANMNAQVGLCRPADYGSDVSHLNLHKTFCIPHGGGGPGAGPIGVKRHLIPYLPSDPLSAGRAPAGLGASNSVASSNWGSPAILPISWSYIRLMGADLKLASQVAILNANYMRKRLESHYDILFTGEHGNVAHEFIIDCRKFKKQANIEATDIAKRLQDFGLHAPTVSWPVSNSLMVEPTESEDKQQLDRYCDALIAIRAEIAAIHDGRLDPLENPIKRAPHTQQLVCASHWDRPYTREQAAFPGAFVRPHNKVWPSVGRVDDTYGDTHLFCACPPVQDYRP